MPRHTAKANDGTLIAFGTDHALGYFFDKFEEPHDDNPPVFSLSTRPDGLSARKLVELLDNMLPEKERTRLKAVIDQIRPKKIMIPNKSDALQTLHDAQRGSIRYETCIDVWYGCRANEWGWQIERASSGVPKGLDPVFYIAGFDEQGNASYGEDFEKIFDDWKPLG